jgi:TIR domain
MDSVLDDHIANAKRLLKQVRFHCVGSPDTLPPEQQLLVPELDAWYLGIDNFLKKTFGRDSSELRLWHDGLDEHRQLWLDAAYRGEARESFVIQRLENAIGILAQIRVSRIGSSDTAHIKQGSATGDIFISYKHEEQATARKLADALEKEGWTVWWDPKLRVGEIFDDVIEKALNEAKCVIVMWSKLSVISEYVKAEATEALEHKKLVPVKIEDVNLPFRFKRVHTLSLIGWDGSKDSSEFRRLVEDISEIVVPPATESQKRQPADNGQSVGGDSSPLNFRTFIRNAPKNKNIKIVGITVKNESVNRLQYCSIRIEKIQPSEPDSLYWIFSDSKIARPLRAEEVFGLNPHDHRDVPIAQLDSINSRFNNLGIELLCYSTQEYPALDLEQSYVLTIRGSAEIGAPIERDYELSVDELKRLCFRDSDSS